MTNTFTFSVTSRGFLFLLVERLGADNVIHMGTELIRRVCIFMRALLFSGHSHSEDETHLGFQVSTDNPELFCLLLTASDWMYSSQKRNGNCGKWQKC